MHILVTGAAGFLGTHLSEKILERGDKVTGLDDFTTGSIENIRHLQNFPNFSFVQQDIRNPHFGEYDGILNFACPASPKHYQADPVRTIETNFMGMINVLHLAKRSGARVVQASTSEVYGDPAISPQVESYWGNVNPIGIRSCYDEGKRAAETLCFDYVRQFDLDVRVIRIFNTYGPRMSVGDGRVVSNFVIQALQGSPITIYGDGSQTRSFCYVSDLVDGIISTFDLSKRPSTPINLGNVHEFTMLKLAQKAIEVCNSKSQIIFEPLPHDDPRQRKPDTTLAKQLLGWTAKVELDEGLQRTADYFRTVI
jgi:UDP-glucuronate decarboxylase